VGNNFKYQWVLYGYETMYRIIDDLSDEHFPFLLKLKEPVDKGMNQARD
jgi:hypothetical protein